MGKDNFITSLDIGASKICCLIGRPALNKTDAVDVLGYGICHHDCFHHGVVSDIKGLADAISRAVYDAEETVGKKAQSVFLNISGSHIKGLPSHGETVISDRDNEITRRDVERAIASAKSISMPYNTDIIYTVKKGFIVDSEKGILDPVGMFGLKLETDLYLITAKTSLIDNLKKAVRQTGIGIEDSIVSGIALSRSVLSKQDKDLGVVLIDIGADLTEIVVFLDSQLSYITVLPIGGDNITKAISDNLHITEGVAERLKIEHGSIEEPPKTEKVTAMDGSKKRSISRKELQEILSAEYNKIFNLIKKEFTNFGLTQDTSSGVVICGQPVMMDGCLELAEFIFGLPVRMGHILVLNSSPKPLASHIYAPAVGLLKYGSESKQYKKSIFSINPKNLIATLTDSAYNLYHDYF